MHFPAFWRKYGWLPTCWTLERKHRLPKRWVNHTLNTSKKNRFDRSALRDVCGFWLARLKNSDCFTHAGLREPSAPAPPALVGLLLQPLFGPHVFRICPERCPHVSCKCPNKCPTRFLHVSRIVPAWVPYLSRIFPASAPSRVRKCPVSTHHTVDPPSLAQMYLPIL